MVQSKSDGMVHTVQFDISMMRSVQSQIRQYGVYCTVQISRVHTVQSQIRQYGVYCAIPNQTVFCVLYHPKLDSILGTVTQTRQYFGSYCTALSQSKQYCCLRHHFKLEIIVFIILFRSRQYLAYDIIPNQYFAYKWYISNQYFGHSFIPNLTVFCSQFHPKSDSILLTVSSQ